MRLEKIRLINFRKFPDATVVFDKGILGIVGPNGSGKSPGTKSFDFGLKGKFYQH